MCQLDSLGRTLFFNYGADGVVGFSYMGNGEYFFKKNIQGDVIGICNSEGVEVVKYVYDAWGNHSTYVLKNGNYVDISTIIDYTNIEAFVALANMNPFRYRGYIFDSETSLYYLQSRYYDPQTGRFINADDLSYADPETINGLNLYAYCNNNPVMNVDPNGKAWYDIFAWIGLGLVAAALTVVTLGAAGIAIGGIAGGIVMGTSIGILALGTVGTTVGVIGGMMYDAVNGNSFGTSIWTWTKAGFGIGAIAGAIIGGAVGGFAGASLAGSNNLMLWTGLGKEGASIAGKQATKLGLKTIGQTIGGKVIGMFPKAIANKMWVWASKLAASTARMSFINVLTGPTIFSGSVYLMYELPILLQRGIGIIRTIWGGLS